ncbi:unnamed protein product [Oikopleura dioica]|uniref:Hexosyltransferase n=1 Tax=Oikopleura dioica TaxID=34765 RepID=E4Y180_OIKDI|nr:unnamed protein product [Oikopleura dioica]
MNDKLLKTSSDSTKTEVGSTREKCEDFKKNVSRLLDFKIAELRGFWREYGYGMVSLFKEDFDKAGGFDVKIIGWGMEDVYLASNVVRKRF